MRTFQWLAQPDAHEVKEQALDAAGIACAALEDAKRGDVAGSLETAEAQVPIVRAAVLALQEMGEDSTEAQNAVLQAERCTAEIRAIVAPTKSSTPWGWIALGVGVAVVAVAWGTR